MIRNSKNTVVCTKHFIVEDLSQVDVDLIKKNDCQIEMNKNNEVVFMVEKNDKPFELTLAVAIEKQLNFLFGSFFF